MTPNLCISWLFAPSHDSQIFCILLMFLAAVIFGGLIGELQVQYQLPFMICMEFSFVCDISWTAWSWSRIYLVNLFVSWWKCRTCLRPTKQWTVSWKIILSPSSPFYKKTGLKCVLMIGEGSLLEAWIYEFRFTILDSNAVHSWTTSLGNCFCSLCKTWRSG